MLNNYQIISQAFFKDRTGKPFQLTQGQSDIFHAIYSPDILRACIATYTQYGKSDTASQAIITAAIRRREKILIVSPSIKQSLIIMDNVIDHLFDHPSLTEKIVYEGSLERLKQERSKNRITFRDGGEIFILTAEAGTVSKEARNLMGFGATIVIADEASLIPDVMFSKILRMVGGVKSGKLIKIGNTFERNHFYRSLNNNRYHKVIIDYKQGIAEGRITQDFIDEAREDMPEADFQIFYECKFPEGGSENSVIPYEWIELAVEQEGIGGDKTQVGLDVARFGRDKSQYYFRRGGNVIHDKENDKIDTMGLVGWCKEFLDVDKPSTVAVDVVGIGSGVADRLREMNYPVVDVNVGASPSDKEKFFNLRAEIFWHLRELFRPEDGKSKISIPNDPELKRELSEIRYSYSSERKIRIEDKEDMKRRIGRSPDKADALALAFYEGATFEPEIMVF